MMVVGIGVVGRERGKRRKRYLRKKKPPTQICLLSGNFLTTLLCRKIVTNNFWNI